MLRRFDRLLQRVDSLPAAVKFWQTTYGAALVREDRNAVALSLRDGGDVVLHNDPNLPEQAFYVLVDDVRAMHASRKSNKLEFRTPPTRGSRGFFATIRDPFGTVLHVTDRTLAGEAAPAAGGSVAEMPANASDLFGASPVVHRVDRTRLAKLYGDLGRTADDLPYTTHFETLYDAYASGFAEPKPGHGEVWRHLLTARKAGGLPKLGSARSKPPELEVSDILRLRDLLGTDIGKRDRLPYTVRFDELVHDFNAGRRRPFSPHQIWRAVAKLSK